MAERRSQDEAVARPRGPGAGGPGLALLHYTAPPVVGGVESILAAHARLLRRGGHDVRIIAGRGEASVVPELDSAHPAARRLTLALASGEDVGAEFDSLRRSIREGIRAHVTDRNLLIAHNVLTMPFNLPLTAAVCDLRLPVVAWTHDVVWTNPDYAPFMRDEWPCRLIMQPQPGVTYVAISEVGRRQLAERFGLDPHQVPVVPNGIDALAFAGLTPAARALLASADALDADPLVLVPQRVTVVKRLELALEAAAELVRRWPRLRLVVTGPVDGHDAGSRAYAEWLLRQRARLGVERAVRFLFEREEQNGGETASAEHVAELYRVSDVVLLTSEMEGFGLPLLEAAAARVPVVCRDIPIFREVGGQGVYAFQRGGHGPQVAAALRRALRVKSIRHRRTILRRHSWAHVGASIEQVVGAALAGARSPAVAGREGGAVRRRGGGSASSGRGKP